MPILLALLPDAGHDQQFLLLAAQRMGPHLNPYGPTVFESNPPLAIWLSAIPVALAALLHLSVTVVFKLMVVLVAAASAFVSARLLRRRQPQLTPERLWLLGIAFLVIFGAVPARDFGQRDHILILLILPYLVAAAAWAPLAAPAMGILPRTLIALTAALGLALKPHEALIPVAVEVTVLILRVGSRRIRLLEPTIFLLAAFAYLSAIRLFAPTYLTEVLPLMRETYWAFGHLSLAALLWAAIELLLLAMLTFAVFWKLRPSGPLVRILLAAGSAATLAYLLQGTGWYYQQLPAISLFALALTLMILGAPSRTVGRWATNPWPAAILTLLALTLTLYFSDFHLTPRGIEQPQPIPDPTFFAGLAPGTAVATLTTSVDDTVPPAYRYHLILAQRYPHLWMLPAILRNESGPAPRHSIPPAQLKDLDRLQHRFMVEDLTRWHPALILVERCQDPQVHCQVLEDRHDDLLAFFLRDPAFAAIFAHYRFLRSSGPFDAYALTRTTTE
jgi:hypothetical protein